MLVNDAANSAGGRSPSALCRRAVRNSCWSSAIVRRASASERNQC